MLREALTKPHKAFTALAHLHPGDLSIGAVLFVAQGDEEGRS
jgi:hypothetical protein